MKLSVVVPVFDGARWLAAALESARAQTLPPDEIVVVDDGSTDDSAAIARAVPGVRVVTQPHAGVAAARTSIVQVPYKGVSRVTSPSGIQVGMGTPGSTR